MQGKLSITQIEDILHKEILGRIGCSINGKSFIFPISYAYDEKYIYAHSNEGLKLQIMRQNPSVCFEVEQMESMADWQTIVIQGCFEELHQKTDKQKAIQALMNRNFPLQNSSTVKLSKYWPFAPNEDEEIDGVFFRIAISEKQGRYEKSCHNHKACSGNCRVQRVLSLEELLEK